MSAIAAFIFSLVQKRIDFQQRRRSVAIAIFVEILQAKEGATSLYVEWEKFKENMKKENFKPLLIISSDIRVLERIKIEDLNYPQAVVSSVTRFHNSIREFYESLYAINSEKFCLIGPEGRLRVVNTAISLATDVGNKADIAIQAMNVDLPLKWFKKIEDVA